MTQQEYLDQLASYLGQPVEAEDPSNPDQCMDWAFKCCDILGIDRATIRHTFAYQVWTNPLDITLQYFEFIPNTSNGIPPAGAFVIFKQNAPGVTGIAGHICTATGEGDSNTFTSYDQNWNGVQHITKQVHTYNDNQDNSAIYGWLVPKMFLPQSIDLQAQLDQKNKDFDDLYNQEQDTLHQLSQAKDEINVLISQLTDCQTKLTAQPAPEQAVNPTPTTAETTTTQIPVTATTTGGESTVVNISATTVKAPESPQEPQTPIPQPKQSVLDKALDWFFNLIGLK